MNIIYDNIIFSLQSAGGISVVWKNLLTNCLDRANISCIEYPGANINLSRKSIDIPSDIVIEKSLKPRLAELFSPYVIYNKKEHFIFHSSYFRTCRHPKSINVTTVHDFIFEQGHPTFKQKMRIALNYRSIRKSDAIVCISNNTKKDLLKYLPDIDPSKISIIYNGVSENYHKLDSVPYPAYNNHVLFVGGRKGYKNFRFTVEALSNTRYNLLICGKPLSGEERVMLDTNLPNKYSFIAFPSNEELNKIYNSVYALIYPSSYEGFGIPILEAQRCKCPVIAFNSSSIPEVAGDGAILLETLFHDALIEALNNLDNRQFKSELIENGYINSQRFSWKNMAENYLMLYQNLLDNKNSNSSFR